MERVTQEQLETIYERGDKSALKGKDLRGLDFSRHWGWRGWDFSGANLQDADLRVVDLRDASLQDADLWRANLQDADLRVADLRGASLRIATLWRANLRNADLRRANLRGASLRGANLRDADLRRADLRGANLRDADLWDCVGDSKTLQSFQTQPYTVVYWKDWIQIGCRNYSADEWRTFSDQEIAGMDFGALDWWREYKDIVLMQHEKYVSQYGG